MTRRTKQARNVYGDPGPVTEARESLTANRFSNSDNLRFSQNVLVITRAEFNCLPTLHKNFAERVLIPENKMRVV